jgi:hypothetical protein
MPEARLAGQQAPLRAAHLLLVLDLCHCVLLAPVDLNRQRGLVKATMRKALEPVLRSAMELAVTQRILLLELFVAEIGQGVEAELQRKGNSASIGMLVEANLLQPGPVI